LKLRLKKFSHLPLAATITFSSFLVGADAQEVLHIPPGVSIGACARTFANGKLQVMICNSTEHTLRVVGTHAIAGGGWPLGDVPGRTAKFPTSPVNAWGYAVNYEIGNTGKYIQFASSYGIEAARRIGICSEQAKGDEPAIECFESRSYSYSGRADRTDIDSIHAEVLMDAVRGGRQWVFLLR
jgi:hypothetical protein